MSMLQSEVAGCWSNILPFRTTNLYKTSKPVCAEKVLQTNEVHSFLQNVIYSVWELFVSIGCSNQK